MAGTVTVACRLPHGIMIQAYNMIEASEPVMGGGSRTVKKAIPRGKSFHVLGTAVPHGHQLPLENGFMLTHGVDADTFNAWYQDNKDQDFIKNGLVWAFASSKDTDIRARAKELRDIKSGFERIDPFNLEDVFAGDDGRLSALQQADEQQNKPSRE